MTPLIAAATVGLLASCAAPSSNALRTETGYPGYHDTVGTYPAATPAPGAPAAPYAPPASPSFTGSPAAPC